MLFLIQTIKIYYYYCHTYMKIFESDENPQKSKCNFFGLVLWIIFFIKIIVKVNFAPF